MLVIKKDGVVKILFFQGCRYQLDDQRISLKEEKKNIFQFF